MERVADGLRSSPVTALLGPRQCGKTTLAREIGQQRSATYFDLEDPNDQARLANPQMALESLRDLYRLTYGAIPLIGVGGISSGKLYPSAVVCCVAGTRDAETSTTGAHAVAEAIALRRAMCPGIRAADADAAVVAVLAEGRLNNAVATPALEARTAGNGGRVSCGHSWSETCRNCEYRYRRKCCGGFGQWWRTITARSGMDRRSAQRWA